MRPKQWLKENGHIADANQRGRLSRENIALIEKAVREGADIDGYAVSKAVPKNDTEKAAPAVNRVETGTGVKRIADIPDVQLRDEKVWKAHTTFEGVTHKVGMRTACNTCGNSLTYCPCRFPVVNVYGVSDTEATGMVTFTLIK